MFIITRGDNGRDQVRKFVKDEIVKELTDMTHAEVIKDAINNLYGVQMTDDEIRYCEADVRFVLDAYKSYKKSKKLLNSIYGDDFTFNIYKMKEEEEKMKINAKVFFNSWCPHTNEVLFILFKDGTHNYYDYIKTVNLNHYGYLYIENTDGCYMKIDYTKIEDWAIGIRNAGESSLSAIPDWFEERINEYTTKKKDTWNLYYTRTDNAQQDRVIIAKTLEEAIEYAKNRYMGCTEPVWFAEADKYDKNVRANNNTPSTLWTTFDGKTSVDNNYTITPIEKYADKIEHIKRELGIPTTGAIEVRYYKGYRRVFNNVEKYEEDTSWGVKTLFITDSAGRRIEIPMASIKEYVVDMPNDKRVVKEKITLDKEELESIIAEMRALEEKLKKIKEG